MKYSVVMDIKGGNSHKHIQAYPCYVFGNDYEDNYLVNITEDDMFTLEEAEAVKAECEEYAKENGHINLIFTLEEHKEYDVIFNDDDHMSWKGFNTTNTQKLIDYIQMNNGTNESYFEDYKGGVVQVASIEGDDEVVYEEIVK